MLCRTCSIHTLCRHQFKWERVKWMAPCVLGLILPRDRTSCASAPPPVIMQRNGTAVGTTVVLGDVCQNSWRLVSTFPEPPARRAIWLSSFLQITNIRGSVVFISGFFVLYLKAYTKVIQCIWQGGITAPGLRCWHVVHNKLYSWAHALWLVVFLCIIMFSPCESFALSLLWASVSSSHIPDSRWMSYPLGQNHV